MKQKTFTVNTVKTIIGYLSIVFFLAWLTQGCSTYNHCPATRHMSGYTILKWHTDSSGLTSIQWRDNNTGKEWGLDYATREELREEGLVK